MTSLKIECPVCEYLTLVKSCDWEICPVCFWEDGGDYQHNDQVSGVNGISVNQAKDNFKIFGACERIYISSVRQPAEDEIPN